MSRPQLDMIELAVAPNKPFFLDDIEIGTQADRPAGEGSGLCRIPYSRTCNALDEASSDPATI